MGDHLSPSGGRDLEKIFGGESKEPKSHLLQGGEPKKLTKFRGGIQRNCHFFQILGGEFFGWGKNFSEGGEYFAKEYPSRWGGISTQNFSGGGYPRQLPPLRPCMFVTFAKMEFFLQCYFYKTIISKNGQFFVLPRLSKLLLLTFLMGSTCNFGQLCLANKYFLWFLKRQN